MGSYLLTTPLLLRNQILNIGKSPHGKTPKMSASPHQRPSHDFPSPRNSILKIWINIMILPPGIHSIGVERSTKASEKNTLEMHHRLHIRKATLPDPAPRVACNLVKIIASNPWDKIENNLQQARVGSYNDAGKILELYESGKNNLLSVLFLALPPARAPDTW